MSKFMSRTRKICVPAARLAGVALFGSLALAGCSSTDPYQRAGTWKPIGVNDANIAAMAANPADLVQGRGSSTGTVRTATSAVDRLWQGVPAARAQGGAAAVGVGAAGGGARGGEAPR